VRIDRLVHLIRHNAKLQNVIGQPKRRHSKKMTDFKTYYNSRFRDDINRFFSTIPDASRFHEDTENKQTFSIQYERLTPAFDHLNFFDKDGKELFAVALFLTVLTDMVCFSHFKTHYSKFRNLTRYPKFIGNCPSGCNYHYHPSDIFFAMNKGRSATEQHLVFYDKFLGAIETMKEETINFFKEHLPEVNGDTFWEKCQKEFPYRQQTEKV
jgi:hypothetical protein